MLWFAKILNNQLSDLSLNGYFWYWDLPFFSLIYLFAKTSCFDFSHLLFWFFPCCFVKEVIVKPISQLFHSAYIHWCICIIITVLSKSVLKFAAWITFIFHAIFFTFSLLPFFIIYIILIESWVFCVGSQKRLIAISLSQLLRTFFITLVARPTLN